MYDRTKPVNHNTIIKTAATCLALILVLIFAPREDHSTTNHGPALTMFGYILLLTVPILTFLITNLILKTLKKAKLEKPDK